MQVFLSIAVPDLWFFLYDAEFQALIVRVVRLDDSILLFLYDGLIVGILAEHFDLVEPCLELIL